MMLPLSLILLSLISRFSDKVKHLIIFYQGTSNLHSDSCSGWKELGLKNIRETGNSPVVPANFRDSHLWIYRYANILIGDINVKLIACAFGCRSQFWEDFSFWLLVFNLYFPQVKDMFYIK